MSGGYGPRVRSLYRRARYRVRRRKGLATLAALAALVGIGVWVFWPGPDLRAGSEVVADGPASIAARTPSSYRIVYRDESRAGGELVVSTQTVSVRRPFEARVEARSGPPPGGKRVALTANAFARVKTERVVLATPPGPAPPDRRPDAFFAEAEKAGYAEQREARRVAGRRCRVYRLAGEPAAPTLAPVAEAKDEYTEVCIDEAGIVLEEVIFFEGKLLSRRVAERVFEEPELSDDLFAVGDPSLDVRQGGGSVRELAADSRPPEKFWEPVAPPKGFEHMGRFTVVPPQTGFDDPSQRNRLVAFTSDVWIDGNNIVVLEQGSTLGGTEPFGADPHARRVRVGALGRGELVYSFTSTQVRVRLEGGRFVRVFGTVPPSRLLAVARSLEEKEGGSLVFTDDAPS